MSDLNGKTALVIGGSRGIGAQTAQILAARGAQVAITFANSADRADEVVKNIEAKGGKALAIKANAREKGANKQAVQDVVDSFGALDILIASGGVFDLLPFSDIDEERFNHSFDLHVKSVIEVVQAAVPHIKEGGSIVTIGSILGDVAPFEGLTLYTASKAAEAGFSKALARELGARNITVNSIQPGPINTEMNPDSDQNPAAESQKELTALKRYGKPEEVGYLAAFLASDQARYITGQTINIDGGWTA